ncbi:MAG: hypothetical protein MRY78_06475 [Saprospiraceae bacterium]|nr:hypothetical protein [Saprospiraceae bacterium]
MNIEKREIDKNKTYRSTHRKLDSKKNILLELNGLLDRIKNRISEHSNYMRQKGQTDSKESIDQMNMLKLYRTKVANQIESIEMIQDESWRDHKPEVQKLFAEAEKKLVFPA